jgi:hypothetical protein
MKLYDLMCPSCGEQITVISPKATVVGAKFMCRKCYTLVELGHKSITFTSYGDDMYKILGKEIKPDKDSRNANILTLYTIKEDNGK